MVNVTYSQRILSKDGLFNDILFEMLVAVSLSFFQVKLFNDRLCKTCL
jgi:hypothetical protein